MSKREGEREREREREIGSERENLIKGCHVSSFLPKVTARDIYV